MRLLSLDLIHAQGQLLPGGVCHDSMNYRIYEHFIVATAVYQQCNLKTYIKYGFQNSEIKPYFSVLSSNPSCPHSPHFPPLDQSFQEWKVKMLHINLLHAPQALWNFSSLLFVSSKISCCFLCIHRVLFVFFLFCSGVLLAFT